MFQFLDSDLNHIGEKNIPEDIQKLHNKVIIFFSDIKIFQTIKGPYVVQINNIRDISQPICEELEDSENKYSTNNKFRTLMLELTDGNQTFKGLEYRHLNSISPKTPKGTKVKNLNNSFF